MTLSYEDLPALLQRLTGDEKHDWSSLSTLDVVWALHDGVLEEGDRFFLSKGHGPTATAWGRSIRRSATIPTAGSCPGSRSRAARSATVSAWPSVPSSPAGASGAPSAAAAR